MCWTALTTFAIGASTGGDLSIDERLLAEVINACKTVLASLRKLPSLEKP